LTFTKNGKIGAWDVSSVTNMSNMFKTIESELGAFNQYIGDWDVSNVTDMSYMMFRQSFNQDVGAWDVSSVVNMEYMFGDSFYFNQDLSAWNVSNVTNMSWMFSSQGLMTQYGSMTFDNGQAEGIGNWNVSNVTNMSGMFYLSSSFNQDLSGWSLHNGVQFSIYSNGATSWDAINHPSFS
jgi:surface protein